MNRFYMSMIVYRQKGDVEAELKLLETTSNDLEDEIDVSQRAIKDKLTRMCFAECCFSIF